MRNSTILQVLLSAAITLGAMGLQITRISVPQFVKNGTEESVVLDCEYEYEAHKDNKLVVKWFHDDDPNPVYQWLSEFNTARTSGKFGDRVNTKYEVDAGNKFTRGRALNMLRPTTEFSGKYSCHISSLAGFDSETETMIVYAHPSNIYVNYSVSDEMVNVMCVVEGVFPIPEIEMYQIGPGKVDPSPVDEVTMSHELEDHAYTVTLSTNITEEELATDSLRYFGCIVSIPGTSYKATKQVPYFPVAKAEMVGADSDEDSATSHRAIFLIPAILVMLQLFLAC